MKAERDSLENPPNMIIICMQEKIKNIVINSVIHSWVNDDDGMGWWWWRRVYRAKELRS